MAKWVVEACLIEAVKRCGQADNLVCVNIQNLTFKRPVNKGDVVDIETDLARVGTTSLTIGGRVYSDSGGTESLLETGLTFVTLNEQGRPTPHGLCSKSR